MKYIREIQVLVDDFRAEVIRAILTAFPGRAVDNEDPNDDTFMIDGVPVRVESDRIVVGDDLDNYIPLKNPPIAGNPPQYRGVDSILVDFKAYVNKEKREAKTTMKTVEIKDTLRVPGTKIFLEEGDRILYKEAYPKVYPTALIDFLILLEDEGWDIDPYDYGAECDRGNIHITVKRNGDIEVTDRYDKYGVMIHTDIKGFSKDYGKIMSKYLNPRFDYDYYRYNAPSKLN